jgi:hypothetical protein
VCRQYVEQAEEIRHEIVAPQMFDRLLPRSPAKMMRLRHLGQRLSTDYRRLVDLSDLLDAQQKHEMKTIYDTCRVLAASVEKRTYQSWFSVATELQPTKLLEKPFLKSNAVNKRMIEVFFDPQILLTLSESCCWSRMKYEIPYSLMDVYSKRKSLRHIECNGHC